VDSQQFSVVFNELMHWLPHLSGQQSQTLRTLLERDGSLIQCLAIIEERGARMRQCLHCSATRIYKHGMSAGLQRYLCLECRKSFNALTGTPLARLRLREKWLPYLQCMIDSRTVRASAAATGIHRNTSFRWRHRFLADAKRQRAVPLQGIVEADETYRLESQKGSRHLTRPARRRGGHARRRGIASEHDCILVARDRSGGTVDFITGRGPVTKQQLSACLPKALAADVLLVTDGAAAYPAFATAHDILHEAVNIQRRHQNARRHPCPEREPVPQPFQDVADALQWRGQPLPVELPGLVVRSGWQSDQYACGVPAGITAYGRENPY